MLATPRALVALPGEPPVSVTSPALPAAITESTPCEVSSSMTAFSGSSAGASSLPSERLMMSRWSEKSPSPLGSSAQSSAGST